MVLQELEFLILTFTVLRSKVRVSIETKGKEYMAFSQNQPLTA